MMVATGYKKEQQSEREAIRVPGLTVKTPSVPRQPIEQHKASKGIVLDAAGTLLRIGIMKQ